MKQKWQKLIARFHAVSGGEIVSFLAAYLMGIITFVFCLLHGGFYWALFFFYLYFGSIRVVAYCWQRHLNKESNPKSTRKLAITMNVLLLLSLIPSLQSGIFVIFYRDVPFYAYSSLAYGYAVYAFFKCYRAIAEYVKGKKAHDFYQITLGCYSIVSGIFTMMALTVLLTAGSSKTQPFVIPNEISIICYVLIGAMMAAIIVLSILGFLRIRKDKQTA